MSAVATLAAALRERILDGELPGGARLVEADLTNRYGVARHTVRAALRSLQASGLVRIEPNHGARVASLGADEVADLYALRRVFEGGAVRLALERHDGRLPPRIHETIDDFVSLCRHKPAPAWHEVVERHAALHAAIVAASDSPRLIRAHADLLAELQLFLVSARLDFPLDRLAADHATLAREIEIQGAEAMEEHVRLSTDALLRRLPELTGAGHTR